MIIAVDNSFAQHLHVNAQAVTEDQLRATSAWSVRIAGDFIIVMNNQLELPVIIRHPQRFNDPRAFVLALKREFLDLLEAATLPHTKIRQIRDAQFATVQFTQLIAPATLRQLQEYAALLTGADSLIDWDQRPSNVDLALQLAEKVQVDARDSGDALPVMDLLEKYSLDNFHLPAHPVIDDHNREYLFHPAALDDIENVIAVSQAFLTDYQKDLHQHGKNDQVIDRDSDIAVGYCSYCEANGLSPLDDVTLPYYYLLHYEEVNEEDISAAEARGIAAALREFARFMRLQGLFANEDFDWFVQAVNQGLEDRYSPQHFFRLQRLLHNMQREMARQRQLLEKPRAYARSRYQVRVSLAGYHPAMWRRFAVGGDTRLDKLCFQVLASFKATGSHLFELQVGNHTYQLPVLNSGRETPSTLNDHWLGEYKPGDRFILNYDFGDSWQFEITVEEKENWRRHRNDGHAHLLDGYGNGIIEDIGGTIGLQQAAADDPTINRKININEDQDAWGQRIARLQRRYE